MPEIITPMVKQYQDIKSQHMDAILFFRLGDFYEMFNDDAQTASRELEITLTGRGEGQNRMPMCGIPYHAATGYISKLINKGYKVAVCEQVEGPATAKSIVKREVIRVFTPGTVQDDAMLDSKASNYLLAISSLKGHLGLAFIEASTGEFKLTTFPLEKGLNAIIDEINRIKPAEILIPDLPSDDLKQLIGSISTSGYSITVFKDTYDLDIAGKKIKDHFGLSSLDSFGLSGFEAGFGAAVAILDYLSNTQKGTLDHVNILKPYKTGDFMYIDNSTRKNLELTETIKDRSAKGSLLWVLDETTTPMGGRLIKQWVLQPQLNIKEINSRLEAVEELTKDLILREELSKTLRSVFDIERLTGRMASGTANARDLVALKESLMNVPKIKSLLGACAATKLEAIKKIDHKEDVIGLIGSSIADDPPFTLKEGGLIKEGYNKELDEIRQLAKGGKQWIAELELAERARTGIKSLKVGFTSVFGYYIEVSRSNLANVPPDYTRKQTLVNCERFITPELKDKEALILNAEQKMFSLEYEVFVQIREELSLHAKEMQNIAQALAELDVLLSFAKAAQTNGYHRSVIEENDRIAIKDGRHPVVERTIGNNMFVPNDTEMDAGKSRFLLITGPNMAGKSTYMRQVALIALMAQVGSFVPAASAHLPIIDRIFTRIGALDDIFSGQSTFMVEMTETANILNNATSKSLVILDEIGRGTSTFDGMSIAAAVAEFIHNKIKAFTLFATHYHEITQLEEKNPGIKNYNTLVKSEGDKVVFLHKIVKGAADRSYGIEVAKLAGMPDGVTNRAKEIYSTLEMVENDFACRKTGKKIPAKSQMGLF